MYSKYFHINKNFQSSINLELDLYSESKINEYIPTTDICDVLKKYVKTILGKTKDRATTLVGPYGKGKSFLLLVLSYLVSNNKDTDCWKNLVKKIKLVDEELYNLLMELKNLEISLVTLILNSNYDNIKQSFQIALNESLNREGLENIIPNTAFTVCIDILNKWKFDERVNKNTFKECLKVKNINLDKLISELQNYSYTAYKQFEDLYNCMNVGLEFNPLVNNDVVKMYKDVTEKISTKGYSGMFIVFDEFSKFLESNTSDLMQNLKILQDFAELANSSSKNNQVNLCCVTHKSMSLYATKNRKDPLQDNFKTVEGRFKEIKFNRSIEENYQLISSAIIKDNTSNKYINEYINSNKEFYNEIIQERIFNINDINNALFKGCFPLNPITVFALIHLSEIVAQNERTLFTFLSDSNEHSLNSFIHNNKSGLFNVDNIYDYFNDLLQKEDTNLIRNIWYRAESLLSKLDSLVEKRLVKAIAIILMLNDNDKLPCSEKILSLSLNISHDELKVIINNLIEKHYLRRNILNNLLSFALSNSKSIDETIEVLSKTKFKNLKYSDLLTRINEKKYIIPRRYNEENKITRFYNVIFMDEKTFVNLYNFDYYFENNYCDGLVINLLRDELSDKRIVDIINKINDNRVIVKWPKNQIDKNLYKISLRYASLEEIKLNKNIDEISYEEINLYLEENEVDLLTLIDKFYNNNTLFYNCLNLNCDFNETLSKVLESIYTAKLIFNNELLNKREVSVQYQKAINHVIDYYVNNLDDFSYSDTSPEMSIKYSVFDYNENDKVFRGLIEDIKEFICNSNNKKIIVYDIFNKYTLPPFGIRNGILPLLFAKAVSELSDNIILYLQSKEIELNSSNMVKAISNNKYSISYSKSSNIQRKYLINMMKLFELNQQTNFRKDIINLTEKIRKHFIGLPKIVRTASESNNFLNLDSTYIKYKNLFLSFNINPYEVIFDEPRKIFNTKNYEDLFNQIESVLNIYIEKVNNFKTKLMDNSKNIFDINRESSFKIGILSWLTKNIKSDRNIILSDSSKQIYDALNDVNYDEFYSINIISKAVLNIYIEDWDKDYSENLYNGLNKFKNDIINAEYLNDDTENLSNYYSEDFSDIGNILKDSIISILEEFSDSVDNNEKVAILSNLMKNLIGVRK